MTTPEPTPQNCPNCGKPLPDGVTLCPNCGAKPVPPLPVLEGKSNDGETLYVTKSRGGDIALGILEGITVPVVLGIGIPALLTWLIMLAGSMLGYLGIFIAVWGSVLFWGGAMFWYINVRKRNPYLFAKVARKIAQGFLIFVGLAVAGLLATCAVTYFR